jgi:hypothetical protein
MSKIILKEVLIKSLQSFKFKHTFWKITKKVIDFSKSWLPKSSFLTNLLVLLILIFGFVGFFNNFNVQAANNLTPTRELICGGSCPLFDTDFVFTAENLARFIVSIARFLTFAGVFLAVFFLVFAGIQFIIGKEDEAKENIRTTLIGLVIIIIAYTIVSLIVSLLQGNFLGQAINGNF